DQHACRTSCVPISGFGPIDIEDLQPGSLKTLNKDGYEALHHLVAKIVIGIALLSETGRVHRNCPDEVDGPCVVAPAIGRNEPRHAYDLSLADGLEDHGRAARRRDLER